MPSCRSSSIRVMVADIECGWVSIRVYAPDRSWRDIACRGPGSVLSRNKGVVKALWSVTRPQTPSEEGVRRYQSQRDIHGDRERVELPAAASLPGRTSKIEHWDSSYPTESH